MNIFPQFQPRTLQLELIISKSSWSLPGPIKMWHHHHFLWEGIKSESPQFFLYVRLSYSYVTYRTWSKIKQCSFLGSIEECPAIGEAGVGCWNVIPWSESTPQNPLQGTEDSANETQMEGHLTGWCLWILLRGTILSNALQLLFTIGVGLLQLTHHGAAGKIIKIIFWQFIFATKQPYCLRDFLA